MTSPGAKAPGIVKQEKAPAGAGGGRRGNRSSRRSGNANAAPKTTKFTGKTDEMKGHIFDVGADRSKQFNDTHEELAELVGRSYKKATNAYAGVQRLNTKSSTEAELVGVSDVLPQVIWTRNFLSAQGYDKHSRSQISAQLPVDLGGRITA